MESQDLKLIYPGKEPRENIISSKSSTFSTTLQYGATERDMWVNRIFWSDNLNVLHYLLTDSAIRNAIDELGGIKLVYIDPPFGTGDMYYSQGKLAYSAELQGPDYIEFVRRRLILLHELLEEDGSIFLRIDYHFGHYLKIILDEIFGQRNFRNEIVINRRRKSAQETKRYNVANDVLLFYSKTDDFYLQKKIRKRLCTFCSQEKKPDWHAMISSGVRNPPERVILGETRLPPKKMHWTYRQEKIDKLESEGRLRINKKLTYVDLKGEQVKGMPEYLQSDKVPVDSLWIDLKGYTHRWKYPSENSEELLDRVISSSSREKDLVLDAFAGSGTTGIVSEKLGRNWILIDSSEIAIQTILRRLFSMKKGIGNRGKLLTPRPFVLHECMKSVRKKSQ
ncbi:MAG: DNA methyltransferase [Candidatus Thorarchaeota archaeon]